MDETKTDFQEVDCFSPEILRQSLESYCLREPQEYVVQTSLGAGNSQAYMVTDKDGQSWVIRRDTIIPQIPKMLLVHMAAFGTPTARFLPKLMAVGKYQDNFVTRRLINVLPVSVNELAFLGQGMVITQEYLTRDAGYFPLDTYGEERFLPTKYPPLREFLNLGTKLKIWEKTRHLEIDDSSLSSVSQEVLDAFTEDFFSILEQGFLLYEEFSSLGIWPGDFKLATWWHEADGRLIIADTGTFHLLDNRYEPLEELITHDSTVFGSVRTREQREDLVSKGLSYLNAFLIGNADKLMGGYLPIFNSVYTTDTYTIPSFSLLRRLPKPFGEFWCWVAEKNLAKEKVSFFEVRERIAQSLQEIRAGQTGGELPRFGDELKYSELVMGLVQGRENWESALRKSRDPEAAFDILRKFYPPEALNALGQYILGEFSEASKIANQHPDHQLAGVVRALAQIHLWALEQCSKESGHFKRYDEVFRYRGEKMFGEVGKIIKWSLVDMVTLEELIVFEDFLNRVVDEFGNLGPPLAEINVLHQQIAVWEQALNLTQAWTEFRQQNQARSQKEDLSPEIKAWLTVETAEAARTTGSFLLAHLNHRPLTEGFQDGIRTEFQADQITLAQTLPDLGALTLKIEGVCQQTTRGLENARRELYQRQEALKKTFLGIGRGKKGDQLRQSETNIRGLETALEFLNNYLSFLERIKEVQEDNG